MGNNKSDSNFTYKELNDKQKDKIANMFPFQCSGNQILYLDDVLCKINYDLHLVIHDSEGYKYKCTIHQIQHIKNDGRILNRFFKRNPFTYENINNFCRLHNIDLYIDGKNLPTSGAARTNFEFITSDGTKINTSWNEIQCNPIRFNKNYENILIERKNSRTISKEDAIKVIYSMQAQLDRPIDSRDFYPKQDGYIGIRTVTKYWGEIWIMQKELGLEVTGKHASILSVDECLKEIENICNMVYQIDNRKLITYNDFSKHALYFDTRPYTNACKKINTTLKEYIESLGFELQKSGVGFNHAFNDGERVCSTYEFEFSKFLRARGLLYNTHYFRDIKYSNLSENYKGHMNCDYEIHFQGRIFYVELAGMLGNKSYEKCYFENSPIKSKSKEKYRLGLVEKKEIFIREGLEHYILLPSNMNSDTYEQILNTKGASNKPHLF